MNDNCNSTAPLILIVDDDRRVRTQLTEHFAARGFRTEESDTAYTAIQAAALRRPSLILMDGLLPQMHGFEVARMINAIDVHYKPRIVILTAIYKHVRYRNEASLKYGIFDYLVKPVDLAALDRLLELASPRLDRMAS